MVRDIFILLLLVNFPDSFERGLSSVEREKDLNKGGIVASGLCGCRPVSGPWFRPSHKSIPEIIILFCA